MNWIIRNKEPLIAVSFAMIVTIACFILSYYSNQESDDPKVLRTFNVTLVNGEKRKVAYWMNRGSEVSVYTYKGSYWLEYTWHSKLGWNIKRAKPGVVDFEEIK